MQLKSEKSTLGSSKFVTLEKLGRIPAFSFVFGWNPISFNYIECNHSTFPRRRPFRPLCVWPITKTPRYIENLTPSSPDMKWTIIIIMTTTTWLRNCSTIECRTQKWVTAIMTWTWLIFIFFWKIHQCVIIACRNVNAGKKKGSKYSIGVSDSIEEASHRSRSKHVWKSQSLNQNKWAGARESHFGQPSHDANINSTFLLIFSGEDFKSFGTLYLVFFF